MQSSNGDVDIDVDENNVEYEEEYEEINEENRMCNNKPPEGTINEAFLQNEATSDKIYAVLKLDFLKENPYYLKTAPGNESDLYEEYQNELPIGESSTVRRKKKLKKRREGKKPVRDAGRGHWNGRKLNRREKRKRMRRSRNPSGSREPQSHVHISRRKIHRVKYIDLSTLDSSSDVSIAHGILPYHQTTAECSSSTNVEDDKSFKIGISASSNMTRPPVSRTHEPLELRTDPASSPVRKKGLLQISSSYHSSNYPSDYHQTSDGDKDDSRPIMSSCVSQCGDVPCPPSDPPPACQAQIKSHEVTEVSLPSDLPPSFIGVPSVPTMKPFLSVSQPVSNIPKSAGILNPPSATCSESLVQCTVEIGNLDINRSVQCTDEIGNLDINRSSSIVCTCYYNIGSEEKLILRRCDLIQCRTGGKDDKTPAIKSHCKK